MLTVPQDTWLSKFSEEIGIGKAEMLRRIIDEHRDRYSRIPNDTPSA